VQCAAQYSNVSDSAIMQGNLSEVLQVLSIVLSHNNEVSRLLEIHSETKFRIVSRSRLFVRYLNHSVASINVIDIFAPVWQSCSI